MTRSLELALKAAADQLTRELKSLGLPLRYKQTRDFLRLDDIEGGWIDLADWDGRPSLGICINDYLGLDKHTIWTGFWLPVARRQEIVELNDRLPDDLRSGTTLTDGKFSQTRPWKLRQHPSARALRRPFIEHYQKYESYLGIYQEDAFGDFDVTRAAAFVRDVIRSVDPTTKPAQKSASPAKSAYIRYAKTFEVQVHPLHDPLQKRFAAFLRTSEKADIEEDLGSVDIRYRDFGNLVLCEVKPCKPDSVRFAIRAAMGQLLDYRQSFPDARLQIVLSVKPAPREMDLALSNGFSVAFPSDRTFRIERRTWRMMAPSIALN